MAEVATPNPASGKDESAASRMGLIEINDLVYKLEADLSVAINRTHKYGFFQNNTYNNTQTSIAIFNSGADYIDPRRSFLSFTVTIPTTPSPSDNTNPLYYAFISGYLGAYGSVLNFIDSVIVLTRSGDEVSRIMDFAQLMYTVIPWTFGKDWERTVGQELGLGSYIGGNNTNRNDSTQVGVSVNHRRTFHIPLYLLSPFFSYGRLLPSMIMSGLRVEIKWKTLETAMQQFWENTPLERPIFNSSLVPFLKDQFQTVGEAYLMGGTPNVLIGTGGLDPTITSGTLYAFNAATNIFSIEAGHASWLGNFPNETQGGEFGARPAWIPGIDIVHILVGGNDIPFEVQAIVSATQLLVTGNGFGTIAPTAVAQPGVWRTSRFPGPNSAQRDFGAPFYRGQVSTPSSYLSGYTISEPTFALCSIQLTDAVQRHLNEYSATNGLEIVFADWDRTSAPLSGSIVPVYQEVRKSASRALQVFATVVDASAQPYRRNSFASVPNSNWNHYQWQLGSLYFPFQRVEPKSSTVPTELYDTMLTLTYAYSLDAWDRFHPKAAPTMMTLRGDDMAWNAIGVYPIPVYKETIPDSYLVPASDFGKNGSYANGNQSLSTTLERSTMFDLSGIPINNSRVLALRGEFAFPSGLTTGTLYIYLKYVRLVRVFLINAEVEQ
jgi:hypothetical protein